MNERDLVNPSKSNTPEPTFRQQRLSRAKFFKIKASTGNYGQYATTIKAYASAGMPFEHIANAGEQLGDPVERGEIDGPIPVQDGFQQKVGEVAEDESKILAWQNRGDKISVIPQLVSPSTLNGSGLVTTTQNPATNLSSEGKQTLDVVEGINVIKQPQALSTASSKNFELENSPFLKPLPDLRKAA